MTEWKRRHHEPMGDGYTSLFFLDEVTALAAGHRPCFSCRRAEARRFVDLSIAGSAAELDRLVHRPRIDPARPHVDVGPLPDGAMIELDATPWAVRGNRLLAWTFDGYTDRRARSGVAWASLLTPPCYVDVLAKGFEPRWHPSADA